MGECPARVEADRLVPLFDSETVVMRPARPQTDGQMSHRVEIVELNGTPRCLHTARY